MAFSTPDLCDAFPDDVRVLAPLLRSFGGREAFAGAAVTVSCFEDNSVLKDLVHTPGAGRVLVVDGGGSLRRALLGDMLAQAAADNGWSGVVLNGCVRDVEILPTIDLGVQALAACPVRSDQRGAGRRDEPIAFGGVLVGPGEHVYADLNGVVVSARQLTP